MPQSVIDEVRLKNKAITLVERLARRFRTRGLLIDIDEDLLGLGINDALGGTVTINVHNSGALYYKYRTKSRINVRAGLDLNRLSLDTLLMIGLNLT